MSATILSLPDQSTARIPKTNFITKENGLLSWLLTGDHKRIAILYLISITFFFFIGGALAGLIRLLALCGLGFGFFHSPNNRLIIGSAPPERSGGAAGLQSVGRLIGQSFGAALVAVAFGRAPEHATSVAIWTAAGLSLVGVCASGLRKA